MAKKNQIKKTILIIEDEKDILLTLKFFLESEDYKVLTAMNGSEAMEILKTSIVPHLILLDMKMPIMDGWQFASEFLKKYDYMSPFIVMLQLLLQRIVLLILMPLILLPSLLIWMYY